MQKCLIISALCALWLVGCGPEPEQVSFSSPEQTFVLEEPLFAGPNSAQVAYEPALDDVLAGRSLENARLSQATFRLPDGQTFGQANIQGLVLQMVTDDAAMVQVAVLNPVPADQNEVSLTVSDEAALGEIFQQSPIYLITDFDLSQDMDTTLTVMGDFKFDLAAIP